MNIGKLVLALAIAGVLALAACGDDGSSSSANNGGTDFAFEAETLDDLPNCTAGYEQTTAFVKDGKKIYVCEDGKWTLFGVDTLVTASCSSVSPESSSDGWEKLSSSSSIVSNSFAVVKSSSSVATSSSSAIIEVSSSSVSESSNLSISYGEMTDSRDWQVYKTVQIGEQTWMAQNLNYAYNQETFNLDSSSFCYNNEPDSCAKYGRLYLWSAVMDSAAIFGNAGKGCGYGIDSTVCNISGMRVRGICPEGWRLPDTTEWMELASYIERKTGSSAVGIVLKKTSGWADYSGKKTGNGTDDFGFSALPAGYRSDDGYFYYAGNYARFWVPTMVRCKKGDDGCKTAYGMGLNFNLESSFLIYRDRGFAFSVRCIKN